MMKITGLSHLFKWENLHNLWLTKYFFAPLYLFTLAFLQYFTIKNVEHFFTVYHLTLDVTTVFLQHYSAASRT